MKQALVHSLQAGLLLAVLGGSVLAADTEVAVEEEAVVDEEGTVDVEAAVDAEAACVRPACSITVGGFGGYYSCEDGYSAQYYDGRFHVFVTGCDGEIYYIYQTRRGPTAPYSGWKGLGGTAFGTPRLWQPDNDDALILKVVGQGYSIEFCKRYSPSEGGWRPWKVCE
jgi:hypothetical protein